MLAARDRRHATLEQALGWGWRSALFLTLAVPGADKTPAGALGLFGWARREAASACGPLAVLSEGSDPLGPFAILGSNLEPPVLKQICVALETAHSGGRLLDADVYDRHGAAVDRAALGIPPRPCLLCEAPAKECIRLGRHEEAELSRRVHELLTPFNG